MVSLGIGMAMPGHWPSQSSPPGVGVRHGYGCACVAQAFGKLPFNKVRTTICRMSDDQYMKALLDANESFISAKGAGFDDRAIAAYHALADRAVELENFTLAFGVDADLSDLHYRRGELALAREAAQRVLDAMPDFYATCQHYLQYTEVRPCEASRDIAERVLINIDIEELRLDDARAVIDRQQQRNVSRRAAEGTDPGQFAPALLISFDLDDLELEVLRARLAVAHGDHATAADHLSGAITALTGWVPPSGGPGLLTDTDCDGLVAQARTILEMARAERTRLDLNTGRAAEGHAGLVAARLRGSGGTGADAQLAELTEEAPIERLRALMDEQTHEGRTAEAAETAFTLGCALLDVGDAAGALLALEQAERGWQHTGQGIAQRPRLALPRAAALAGSGRPGEALALAQGAATLYAEAGAGYDAVRADIVTALVATSMNDASQADVALVAALGAESLRYTLGTAPEREAWDATAVQPAIALTITMLAGADRPAELAALLERRAAVGALELGHDAHAAVPVAKPALPQPETLALAAGAAPLSAVAPGPMTWRLTPPPESPSLAAAAEHARRRYRLPQIAPTPAMPPQSSTTRIAITLRFVEVAGAVFRVWRSSDDPTEPHISQLHPATLPTILTRLAHALPTPLHGEDQAAALTRARAGALADPAAEADLAAALGAALLGGDLADALLTSSPKPLLLVQPSPALEAVPWALLALATGTPDGGQSPRAVAVADIAMLAPEGVVAAAAPVRSGAGMLRVIEPTGTGLGRLLRQDAPPSSHVDVHTRERCSYGHAQLVEDLAHGPASFMYLGHVGAPGAEAGLQLSDGAMTALELATIPMPPRVALLGCSSAKGVGRADAASLPRAAISAGAEVVIATPWTLPTAAGLATPDGSDPLADLGAAVESSLQAPIPITAINDLVRAARHRWLHADGPPPLLWGGLITLVRGQTWDR